MSGKRFQVFVSSTYEDLVLERQAVNNALLQLNCIPAGMELFPAANESQWALIKRVIDDCDYYVVIVAGRYGSIGRGGLSYTEMEYNYAVRKRKPIIAFLHGDIFALPPDRCESQTIGKQKLAAFTDKLKRKLVRFWRSPGELSAAVATSLVQLIKDCPAEGLVRPSETDAFVLRGYTETMARLESMAAEARYNLWTVRTHMGEGTNEQRYFEMVAERLGSVERPLEDFRRIIRLAPRARMHLMWLVDRMSCHPTARVYYFGTGGPQFDFVSVDGKVAAIGFTMSGGEGNLGAVVLNSSEAVAAVDAVYLELERSATLLFQGREGIDDAGKDALRTRIDALLSKMAPN